MSLEVGAIVEGVVSGITNFGAFVDLPDNKVGLIHISEVSNVYVKNVNDFLKEREKVKVKVLSIDDRGKIGLSIKQLIIEATPPKPAVKYEERQYNRPAFQKPIIKQAYQAPSFEDKMNRFLKDSDDRLTDLKKNTESKRGGRGAGRRNG